MAGELDWEGLASLGECGIREALDAAGIDCSVDGRPESQYEAACMADNDAHAYDVYAQPDY